LSSTLRIAAAHPPRRSPAYRAFTLIPKAAGCVLHKSCATREVALTVNLADRVRSLESILFLAGARLDTRASNGLSRARQREERERPRSGCTLLLRNPHPRPRQGRQAAVVVSLEGSSPTRVGTTWRHTPTLESTPRSPHARGDD